LLDTAKAVALEHIAMEVLKDELLLPRQRDRWDNSFNLLNHLGVQP